MLVHRLALQIFSPSIQPIHTCVTHRQILHLQRDGAKTRQVQYICKSNYSATDCIIIIKFLFKKKPLKYRGIQCRDGQLVFAYDATAIHILSVAHNS